MKRRTVLTPVSAAVGSILAEPLVARLGIHILIENVWNGMFYEPKGPNTQSADLLKNYLNEINSPWVGSYFDIGNHQRFGKPAEWIKTLGNSGWATAEVGGGQKERLHEVLQNMRLHLLGQ